MVSKTRTHIRVQAMSRENQQHFTLILRFRSFWVQKNPRDEVLPTYSTFGKPTIIMLGSAHLQSELVLGIVSNHNKKKPNLNFKLN